MQRLTAHPRGSWLTPVLLALAIPVMVLGQSSAGSAPASSPEGLPVSRLEGADGPAFRQSVPPPPGQLSPLPVTQLAEHARAVELDGPRTVSVTLSHAMPVTEVLMLLVRGTPLSIVTDASVGGTFIGDLKDLTMRQALEAVLFPHGFEYAAEGNVIRVFAKRPETRLFELNYLNLRRTLHRRVRARTAVGEESAGAELLTSSEADVFAEVDAGVKALLSPAGRSHVDRTAGLVQVTDLSDRLDRVAAYLDAVHVRAVRQVRLAVRVLEVSVGEASGIDWNTAASRAGTAFRTSGPGVATAGMRLDDVDALVKAIGEQGTLRMIAAPHLVATHNEPSIIRAGINGVYQRSTPTTKDGAELNPATVAEGLTLTITPHVGADGLVQLNIAPSWAEKTDQVRSRAGDVVPVMRVIEADTIVRVQEGETVVISGLLHERTESRLSPGFSGFFGGQERRTVRAELVVLLTPTLVIPGLISTEGMQ